MTKYVFIDTNVFINYRSLKEIDWLQVTAADKVVIVLVPVNIRELNYLKDSPEKSPKTRKRAASALKIIKETFKDDLEVELRSNTDLIFEARDASSDIFDNNHLRDLRDDHFIASIIKYRVENNDNQIVFFTHDFGMRGKAKLATIETLSLPEKYKLPDEPDEQQVKIRQLEKELKRFKSRLPDLKLKFQNGTQELIFSPYKDNLEDEFIKGEMESVKAKHPQKNPEAKAIAKWPSIMPMVGFSSLFDIPLSEFDRYNNDLETYYENYKSHLRDLVSFLAAQKRTIPLLLQLDNNGTSPATDVDVILEIKKLVAVKEEHDNDEKPIPPQPPKEPRTQSELQFDFFTELPAFSPDSSLSIDALLQERLRPSTVQTESATEVHFHINKIKHKCTKVLETIFLEIESDEEMKNFSLHYTINSHEAMDDFKGQLIVKIEDE